MNAFEQEQTRRFQSALRRTGTGSPCFEGTLAPVPVNIAWAADARFSSSEAEFGNAIEMKKTASMAISMDASHVVT